LEQSSPNRIGDDRGGWDERDQKGPRSLPATPPSSTVACGVQVQLPSPASYDHQRVFVLNNLIIAYNESGEKTPSESNNNSHLKIISLN
jgi:hypothetical protein